MKTGPDLCKSANNISSPCHESAPCYGTVSTKEEPDLARTTWDRAGWPANDADRTHHDLLMHPSREKQYRPSAWQKTKELVKVETNWTAGSAVAPELSDHYYRGWDRGIESILDLTVPAERCPEPWLADNQGPCRKCLWYLQQARAVVRGRQASYNSTGAVQLACFQCQQSLQLIRTSCFDVSTRAGWSTGMEAG